MKNMKATYKKAITLIAVAVFALSIGMVSAFSIDASIIGNEIPIDNEGESRLHANFEGNHGGISFSIPFEGDDSPYWREFTPEEYDAFDRGEIDLGDGVIRSGWTSPDGSRKISVLLARPTSSTVIVNGESISFDAYNILGSNYFKLRDLAYALHGTEKQFEVGWDSTNNAISLTSGSPYTTVGGEMASGGSADRTPLTAESKIYLDGREVRLPAFSIGGNNFFRLRDVGEAFDFGVSWNGATNTIAINTGIGYTPE